MLNRACPAAFTAEKAIKLDAEDQIASFRDRFILPEDKIYLDGNSLGVLPKKTATRVNEVIKLEWGCDLISSWNKHDWISYPHRLGNKLARLLGGRPDEVIVTDNTSANIFKTVSAALDLQPGRKTIVSELRNFPTDLYVLEGLIKLKGGSHRLVLLEDPNELLGEIDLADVAVVLLTHVSYCSGSMLDMKAITSAVQKGGALMVWDLAHSAGAVPVDLNDANADFAVGCGYKYLNGGPGAPAFIFVAKRHQEAAANPLSGWMGHKAAFAFESSYQPASGISRFLCGTPPILSLAALEVGLDITLEADQIQLREKSVQLSELFIGLLAQECGEYGFKLISPKDPSKRGSQVNISHQQGYAIIQALIARGVIGDFRMPNVLRFGFTPLYTRFKDVWDAVQALRAVMQGAEWDNANFMTKSSVT